MVGGGDRGKKPFSSETVNGERDANSFGSVGIVLTIGKDGAGMIGLIVLWRVGLNKSNGGRLPRIAVLEGFDEYKGWSRSGEFFVYIL